MFNYFYGYQHTIKKNLKNQMKYVTKISDDMLSLLFYDNYPQIFTAFPRTLVALRNNK